VTSPIIPEVERYPSPADKMPRLRSNVEQAKWQPDPNTRFSELLHRRSTRYAPRWSRC
jgi:hypothetical protein